MISVCRVQTLGTIEQLGMSMMVPGTLIFTSKRCILILAGLLAHFE